MRAIPLLVLAMAAHLHWVDPASFSAIPQFGVGNEYAVVLKSDGTLWTWGDIDYGTVTYTNRPVQIGSETNWVFLAVKDQSNFAIKNDGSLWAWGNNQQGQLGSGLVGGVKRELSMVSGGPWSKVFPLGSTTYGIKSGGTLWAWGRQPLGNGQPFYTNIWPNEIMLTNHPDLHLGVSTPVQVGTNETGWAGVFSGHQNRQIYGLKQNGDLFAWGFCAPLSPVYVNSPTNTSSYGGMPVYFPTFPVARSGWQGNGAMVLTNGGFQTALMPLWTNAPTKVVANGTGAEIIPDVLPNLNSWPETLSFGFPILALQKDGTIWRNAYTNLQITFTVEGRVCPPEPEWRMDGVIEYEWNLLANGKPRRFDATLDFKTTNDTTVCYKLINIGTAEEPQHVRVEQAPRKEVWNHRDIYWYRELAPSGLGGNWEKLAWGGYHEIAGIKFDGSLWAWGRGGVFANALFVSGKPTQVDLDFDWYDAKIGNLTVLAMKVDGSLWGYGWHRFCVRDPADWSPDCERSSRFVKLMDLGPLDLPGRATVVGSVLDRTTGQPISGASVIVAGKGTSTDAGGHYEIAALKPGRALATANAPDHLVSATTIQIPRQGLLTRNFYLDRGLRLEDILGEDPGDLWDPGNTNNPSGGCLTNGVPCDSESDTNGNSAIRVVNIENIYGDGIHFLDGVDLNVEFTATVDWGKSKPGTVTFITPRKTENVQAQGNTAKLVFNVGKDFGPGGYLKVTATAGKNKAPEKMAKMKVMGNPFRSGSRSTRIAPATAPAEVIEFKVVESGGEGLAYETTKAGSFGSFDGGVSAGTIPADVKVLGAKAYTLGLDVGFTGRINGQGELTMSHELTDVRQQTGGTISAQSASAGESKIGLAGLQAGLSPDFSGQRRFGDTDWLDWSAVKLDLGGKVALGTVIPLWPIPPTFLTTSLSVGAAVQGQVRLSDPIQLSALINVDAEVQGTVFVTVLLGSVSGTLSGGSHGVFQIPEKPFLRDLSIFLQGSVKYYVLWFQVGETKLLDANWSLLGGASGAAFGPQAFAIELAERTYLENSDYAQFASKPGAGQVAALSTASAGGVLQANINPLPEPHVASAGTNVALTWLWDDPKRSSINRSVAVMSRFNGSFWSQPAPISDDGTADFNPQLVALDNGVLVAAWVNENQTFADSATINQVAPSLEITASVYDPLQQKWAAAFNLTTNRILDFGPRLAGTQGNLVLVWLAKPSNDLLGTNGETQVWSSQFNGSSWSQPGRLAALAQPVISFDLAASGNSVIVVLSVDLDGNLETVNDHELFSLRSSDGQWGSLQRLTTDTLPDDHPKVVYLDSEPFLVWLKNDELSAAANLDFTKRQVVRQEHYSSNAGQFELAQRADGKLAVVWPEASASASDLWVQFYDPAVRLWGRKNRITSDPQNEQALTLAWIGEETLLASYARKNEPGQTDLYVLPYKLKADVALEPGSLKLDDPNSPPGDAVVLQATAVNLGDAVGSGLSVNFYHGDPLAGGALIGKAALPGPLVPGDKMPVSLDWVLPEFTAPLKLYARLEPSGDQTPGNEIQMIQAGQPDVRTDLLGWRELGNGTIALRLSLQNVGAISSAPVTVRVSPSTNNQMTLASQPVGVFVRGQATETEILVTNQAQQLSWIVSAEAGDDFNRADNQVAVEINLAYFAERSANLVVSQSSRGALKDRPVTVQLQVKNLGPAPASEVRVFNSLLPGVELVSARQPRGTNRVEGDILSPVRQLVLDVGSLTNGESVDISLVLRTPALWLTNRSTVQARETDPDPVNNRSGLMVPFRLTNALPMVKLLAPINNAIFEAPAAITLTAEASDPDGAIAKVKFWQGGTPIGETLQPPYSMTLSNVAAGFYGYFASAIDDSEAEAASATAFVQVRAPVARPEVAILAPANGTILQPGISTLVRVQAQDPNPPGILPRVSVYDGTGLLTNLFAPPYEFIWSNIALGEHLLSAAATGFSGLSATSAPVRILVEAPAPTNGGYRLTDLGGMIPAGLNHRGQVAGYRSNGATNKAVIWTQSGGMREIPTGAEFPNARAAAINDAGFVAGTVSSANYETNRAFLWSESAGYTALGTLGGKSSEATALNASNAVVGISTDASGFEIKRAFVWTASGGMKNLGGSALFDPSMRAYDINDTDQIVGYQSQGITFSAFFRSTNGALTPFKLPGSENAEAYSINNAGVAVGSSARTAFIWDQQTGIRALAKKPEFPFSSARSINNSGQVVGQAALSNGVQAAVLWNNGFLTNLNDLLPPGSGWTLTDAVAINDTGEIIGAGIFNNQLRGYLLAPPVGPVSRERPRFAPPSVELTSLGEFRVQILAQDQQQIIVQTSTNLVEWTALLITNAGPNGLLFRHNAVPLKVRFYRAITP